jgi:hypothetical protein
MTILVLISWLVMLSPLMSYAADEAYYINKYYPNISHEEALQVYHQMLFEGLDVNDEDVIKRIIEERSSAPTFSSSSGLAVDSIRFTETDKGQFDIGFTIKNSGLAAAGLKYKLVLRKPDNSTVNQTSAYEYIGEGVLSVGSKEELEKTVKVSVPSYVTSGTYVWYVEIGNEAGAVLVKQPARQLVQIANNPTPVIINQESCYLTVNGEGNFNLRQGVDVATSEALGLVCGHSPLFEELVLNVDYYVFIRNTWGKNIKSGVDLGEFIISSSTDKLNIKLPVESNPQAYDLVLNISAKDQDLAPITVHYVIQGESATIHNFNIAESDSGMLSFVLTWSGSADSFAGSRSSNADMNGLVLDISAYDNDSTLCYTGSESLVGSGSLNQEIISLELSDDCNISRAELEIKSSSGTVLSSRTFDFSAEDLSVAEEDGEGNGGLFFLIVTITSLTILGALAFYLWKKRGPVTTAMTIVLVSGLASSYIALADEPTWLWQYASWNVAGQVWEEHDYDFMFAGPSGVFYGLDPILFSGSLSSPICANTPNISNWELKVVDNDFNTVLSDSNSGATFYSKSWTVDDFPLPGTYKGILTWTDSFCQNFGEFSPGTPSDPLKENLCDFDPTYTKYFYFTVAKGPDVTFTGSKTYIDPGDEVKLIWNVEGATSCSASEDWSGVKSEVGSHEFLYPTEDSTYRLSCVGPGGVTSEVVNVYVSDPPSPVVGMDAVLNTEEPIDSFYLTWTVAGASSCEAGGLWSGNKDPNGGTEEIFPTISGAYTLSCSNGVDSTEETIWIDVPSVDVTIGSCVIPPGSSDCQVQVSWTTSNFLGNPTVSQGEDVFSTANSGSEWRTVTPDNYSFAIADTGSVYSFDSNASVGCLAGSTWSAGGVCACA